MKPKDAGMKAPTASPRNNWSTMIVPKSRVNGTRSEVTAKITLVHSINRGVPTAVLSQAALGATTI